MCLGKKKVNRKNYKHFIDELSRFPNWIKSLVSAELAKTATTSDKSVYSFTEYRPILTFKGSCELKMRNTGFDVNIYNILDLIAKDYSIAEISLDTYLTLEEIASYFLMCISEKYLEKPENSQILSVANYLSGRYKIGEYLVSTKVISEKQLEKAIEVDLNSKNNRKFGQILIDLGFIKEESLKAIILLKDEAKKRFILDYHEVPKSEFAYANMADEYKKKIDDLQAENKKLKAKLNQLLAMVKTNEY